MYPLHCESVVQELPNTELEPKSDPVVDAAPLAVKVRPARNNNYFII